MKEEDADERQTAEAIERGYVREPCASTLLGSHRQGVSFGSGFEDPVPLQMADIGVTQRYSVIGSGSGIGGPGPSANTSVMAGSGGIYSQRKSAVAGSPPR